MRLIGKPLMRRHASVCPPAGVIVPRVMEYALPAEPLPYNLQKAKQLLAEAGYPNGFDAGDLTPFPLFTVGEAVLNSAGHWHSGAHAYHGAGAFLSAWREKKLRGLFVVAVGTSGNAATRAGEFICSQGAAYGGYRILTPCASNRLSSGIARDGKRSCIVSTTHHRAGDVRGIIDFRALVDWTGLLNTRLTPFPYMLSRLGRCAPEGETVEVASQPPLPVSPAPSTPPRRDAADEAGSRTPRMTRLLWSSSPEP